VNAKIKFESSAHDVPHELNGKTMKKQSRRKRSTVKDALRTEYDFSKGVRGKHAARYAEGTNVVVLDPDVAQEFRTTEQVNETLRAVSNLRRKIDNSAGQRRHKGIQPAAHKTRRG
jgi:hypothetical protein